MMQEREQVIFELPLLAKLPPEDLRALATVARVQHHRPGTVIFRQGEPGDALHAILEGAVRIEFAGPAGGTTMAVLGPGECFGELAVLDGRPRSANAVAAQATRTLIVTRKDFVDWLSNRPRAALVLLETMSLRLRSTNEAFIDLAFFDLPHRLVRRLLRLAASDLKSRTGHDVRLSITQSELASMLGVSRESVNKQLQTLIRIGWIGLGRCSVTIKCVEALIAVDAIEAEV